MQPPEQPRELIHDFRRSTNILLIALFSVGTTVQLYSRVAPGRLFFGWMLFVGMLIQSLYAIFKSGLFHHDAIPLQTVLGVNLIAFALHGIYRRYSQRRGVELHSYDPGYGLLAPVCPSLPNWITALLSDVAVAVELAVFCHVAQSPVLRDWYLWIALPSMVISQAWGRARDQFLRQRHIDAAEEARHYSQTIARR